MKDHSRYTDPHGRIERAQAKLKASRTKRNKRYWRRELGLTVIAHLEALHGIHPKDMGRVGTVSLADMVRRHDRDHYVATQVTSGGVWHAGRDYQPDGSATTLCGRRGWVDHRADGTPLRAGDDGTWDDPAQPVECLTCSRKMTG